MWKQWTATPSLAQRRHRPEWKRVLKNVVDQVPERVLFTGEGEVISEFTYGVKADDLVEIFSPHRVLASGDNLAVVSFCAGLGLLHREAMYTRLGGRLGTLLARGGP